MEHHSVLVHLSTKFQLDKSKFAWVRQFWKNSQKIQNLKKYEKSVNREREEEEVSKFGTMKCRTIYFSEFQNFEYLNNERWVVR